MDRSLTFSPLRLMQAMLQHKDTLEILDLDVETDVFAFEEEEDKEEREIALDTEFYDDLDEAFYARPMLSEDRTSPESIWEQSGSLKDFAALKRLTLGVNILMYYAR